MKFRTLDEGNREQLWVLRWSFVKWSLLMTHYLDTKFTAFRWWYKSFDVRRVLIRCLRSSKKDVVKDEQEE